MVRRLLAVLLLSLSTQVTAQSFNTPANAAAQMMALIWDAMSAAAGERSGLDWPSTPFGYPMGPSAGMPSPGDWGDVPGWGDGASWDWSLGGGEGRADGGWGDPWSQDGKPSVARGHNLGGVWVNEAGEYFAVEGKRFALWAGPERSVEGTFEIRGDRLRTWLPQSGEATVYSFVQSGDTMAMIDPNQQVLVFRRIRRLPQGAGGW